MADIPDNPGFTLFSYLPTEIRLQIWRLSCIPRVVTVTWDENANHYSVIATVQPPNLQVNSESRTEAKRIYAALFILQSMIPIYFAPDLDTLYVARNNSLGYSCPARYVKVHVIFAPELVRSLAVDHVSPSERKEWETYSKWCLFQSLPRLEEVYLVLGGLDRNAGSETGRTPVGHRQQTIELAQPASQEVAGREMEEFVDSWIYDLLENSGWNQNTSLIDDVRRNKFLSTILCARRGDKWKQLWKCREARVTSYGSESEWWSTDRRTDLDWVDLPDSTIYQTRNGVWYYRKGQHISSQAPLEG